MHEKHFYIYIKNISFIGWRFAVCMNEMQCLFFIATPQYCGCINMLKIEICSSYSYSAQWMLSWLLLLNRCIFFLQDMSSFLQLLSQVDFWECNVNQDIQPRDFHPWRHSLHKVINYNNDWIWCLHFDRNKRRARASPRQRLIDVFQAILDTSNKIIEEFE